MACERALPETMRAAWIDAVGSAGAIRVGELPVPAPGPTDVLVRVTATAVDPVDTFVRSGAYPTPTPFPFVLAATLEPATTAWRDAVALLALFCWALGTFLYAAIGILVAARLLTYRVSPAELTPSYWVAMGATAISTMAAAEIMTMADAPSLTAARGLVAGTALAFWAFGSWLIPVLVAAGWWRHVRHRVPLRYDSTVWVVIFPLGMYGVASHSLGEAAHLPIVTAIGAAEAWVALLAWAVTFVAMLIRLGRALGNGATGTGGPGTPRA